MNAKTRRAREAKTPSRRLRFRAGCAAAMTLLLTSCAPQQKPNQKPTVSQTPAPQSTQNEVLDPCADKLQEISGLLLVYYAQYHNLPDTLAEIPGITPELMQCNSRQFTYRSEGIEVAGALGGRIVVYEPPGKHGTRWGVLIVYPREGQAISARVVAVPETIK